MSQNGPKRSFHPNHERAILSPTRCAIGLFQDQHGGVFNAWLTGVSKFCAIPRPQDACAATVQFMGTCQHAISSYAR
jgi:hypothetical protein